MVIQVTSVKLSSGNHMPMVGLGTFARNVEPGTFRQAVEWAIDAGYRHIDTATRYNNETEVGEAINKKIMEGIVSREQLFVTTKLWNDCHAEEDVVPSLNESLAKLKLDYVDLYLVHWPMSISADGKDLGIDFLETWRGMEEALKLGLTKSIGVSNFNEQQLERLIKAATVQPAVNQIEINPTFTQHKLVDFCKGISVVPVAYSPLGLLSEAKGDCEDVDTIKQDPKLGDIAQKYGKSRAQVALKYLIQRGIPVIPKSFKKSRIEENLNLFDFELTQDEMAIVDAFNIDHRCLPYENNAFAINFPFNLQSSD